MMEELTPDLRNRLLTERWMRVLKHPLVFGVPYMPELNAEYNRMYLQKKRRLREAHNQQNWSLVVWLHERPFRPEALRRIRSKIESSVEYWKLVRQVWEDTEAPGLQNQVWQDLLVDKRSNKIAMMTADERNVLLFLPKNIPVWRGGDWIGRSWTLDRHVAEFFSRRHRGNLMHGTVKKTDVLAYLDGRGEKEILVVNSSLVQNIQMDDYIT